jgi:hypothetical protein
VSPLPIRVGASDVDLSARVFRSATVVASPSAAAETTIASVTVSGDLATALGVLVVGFAAYTVGTNGTAVNFRIRQTDTSGTIIKATGATTATAANLGAQTIAGVDAGQVAARQVYVLTMTVTAGSAASTVSAVEIVAIAV